MKRAKPKPKYVWDDLSGVVELLNDGMTKTMNHRQAIQLLLGPASREFRTRCGKLLVEALNKNLKGGGRG